MTRRWQGSCSRWLCTLALGCAALRQEAGGAPPDVDTGSPATLRAQFLGEVDHRLDVPAGDQQRYLVRLQKTLADANISELSAQAFLLVDRSAQVQAAFVVVRTQGGGWDWVGATAMSTGKTGTFEHFLTPLGVFPHTLDNPDFRAEGTFNKNHIRGYGLRGRRIFDFGWQTAERGWGAGGTSKMRLQMHATDPTILESPLGRVASEGCIRIPATLNVFLDRHGILDADYQQGTRRRQAAVGDQGRPTPFCLARPLHGDRRFGDLRAPDVVTLARGEAREEHRARRTPGFAGPGGLMVGAGFKNHPMCASARTVRRWRGKLV